MASGRIVAAADIAPEAGQPGQLGQLVQLPPRGGPGRPQRAQMVKDGPLALAVLVGKHDGRWSHELSGRGAACRALASQLSSKVGAVPEWMPSGAVWGLAVVRQWRYVLDTASTQDMLALMKASNAMHCRRQGQLFLEHEVLAAAMVLDTGSPATSCPVAWPPRFAGERLVEGMRASAARLRCTRGPAFPRHLDVQELLAHWASTLQVSLGSPLSWQVATPLAMAMARGVWDGDVSVHFRRVTFGEVSKAPTQPSAGMLRHFASMDVPVGYPHAPPSLDGGSLSRRRCSARPGGS